MKACSISSAAFFFFSRLMCILADQSDWQFLKMPNHIYITPSSNVCLGKPKLLAQPLVMGIHLFDFTLWLTLVHSGSLSGPQRHPLYIAEAPPSGHENLSRQWQIQHTTESKWQIQHTTTITFTQPLDLRLLQENPSTLNTSG